MRNRLAALAACLAVVPAALGQDAAPRIPVPRLNAVHPAGARAGTSVELKISAGTDLDGAARLLFSHPGIAAEPVKAVPDRLRPQARVAPGTFAVRVAADVPPGVYEVRAAGVFGISNARRFVVGEVDEVLEREPNNDPATAQELALDGIVNGTLDAQNFDAYRVAVKKGQRLLADCQALRIDSRAQPVLQLLDANGREVRRVLGTKYRDPLLDVSVEADGILTILVYDLLYRGGPEYGYRLSVGTNPWIDYAEPCVLKPGADNPVIVYGRNLPGGAPAGFSLDGRPVEKLAVTIKAPAAAGAGLLESPLRPSDASADLVTWRLPGSNAIRFALGDEPLVAESSESIQAVSPPVQMSGRFEARGDRDWVTFEAKKGERLWIEVVGQRLGHPVDPQLVIQQVQKNEKGEAAVKDLSDADDQPLPMPAMGGNMEKKYRAQPEDPAVLFTAPADGTFRVLVRDLFASSQGDPRFAYRLVIRPARPDFRLVAFPLETMPADQKLSPVTCVVRRGGAERVRVVAFRREGFSGPIRIEAADLPPGVTARPALIPAEGTSVDLILTAAPDAPAFAGSLRLHGWADVDGKPVGRPAAAAEALFPVGDMQKDAVVTRLTETLALAVDASFTAPLAILSPDSPQRVSRAGKLKLPVRLAKQAEVKDLDKGQVKIAVQGLPGKPNEKSVAAKELTIAAGKPEGELEIDVSEKAPAGRVSIHLTGDLEVAWTRTPERLKAAQDEQKRLDMLAAELAAELKKASEAKRASEAGLAKAKAAKTDPSGVKAAEDEFAAAVETEKKAADLAKGADALKKEAAEELKKATEACKEKKIKVWMASPSIELDILPGPAALEAPASVTVKPGESAALAVILKREPGFADEVKVELAAPQGSALKLAQPITVAAGTDQASGSIAADKAAKPGSYPATLKAALKLNGKTLVVERAIEIRVE
jgi:hypothetical protein